MIRTSTVLSLAAAALFVSGIPSAHSASVTLAFNVHVDSSSVAGVAVGDVLSGSFTYDDTVAGVLTPAPNPFVAATIDYSGALTGMSVDINGTPVGATSGDIRYTDSVDPLFMGGDQFSVSPDSATFTGELNPSRQLTSMGIFGSDNDATTVDFLSQPDPLATVSPAAFPSLIISLGFGPSPGSIFESISGTVDITTVVPLPAALWLFGSGIAGLWLTSRRVAPV